MRLLVYKDNQLIQEIELFMGQTYVAGRKENSSIQLEKLPGISRQHFEVQQDHTNAWRVRVMSDTRLIQFQGEETDLFQLAGRRGKFFLPPYTFEYTTEAASNHMDGGSNPQTQSVDAQESSYHTQEKTSIQTFSGLPYIKIIGRQGKKSEYFRLEGNLWVIGGDETASVQIKESSASQKHFEISKTENGYFVLDLGSPQGTELNGQKLTTKKHAPLFSGDILTVGHTSLQFELRDKAFKQKVSNIPLSSYQNPLIFFGEDVAMVSLEEEPLNDGKAQEIDEPAVEKKQNKLRPILMAVAAILIAAVVSQELLPTKKEQPKKEINATPFSRLSPTEQKIVHQTYRLASQLYLNKNYELSLIQLDKIHAIIDSYKDSKKMEEDCINAREIQQQKALREKQRRQQEQMEQRVHSAISQCEKHYVRSSDIDGVKACLVPASNLDPNNPRIAQLITEVTARQEEDIIRRKMASERADKVKRGTALYQKAYSLHRKQKWLDAIEAYENHIHSGLPDPKGLVRKSKRQLASIEHKIKTQKNSLMSQAKIKYQSSQIRDSIKFARKAQKVDPYDPSISSFLFKAQKELKHQMKKIYMDSIIEEQFGNLDASRSKWEEIIRIDIEDGEYYIKAKRKLKRYGFKH